MSGPTLKDEEGRPADAALDEDRLEAIRLAVAEKLRRDYHQSPAFARDAVDEVIDQAYVEYAEKPEPERERVKNLPGLLITTAIRRAIDKARREGREVYGDGAQAIIDNSEAPSPSTEALAVHGIEVTELYDAVANLHHEQRQALALLYWEGLSTRDAAERMGVGTMTVCRRRDDAMDTLRARFGVDADTPVDKHLGREAGFSAWAGLIVGVNDSHGLGARVADQVVAATTDSVGRTMDAVWNGVTGIGGRVREVAARFAGTGSGESVGGAITNGTAGGIAKVGTCVVGGVAAMYCGAGVVGIGPGVGGLIDTGGDPSRPAVVRPHVAPSPSPPQPAPRPQQPAESGARDELRQQPAKQRSTTKRRRDRQGRVYSPPAERAVRSQSLESAAPEPAPESDPEPVPEAEPTYVGEPGGGGSSAANTAAAEQFGLP